MAYSSPTSYKNARVPFATIEDAIVQESVVSEARIKWIPRIPPVLKGVFQLEVGGPTSSYADEETIQKLFPRTFGQRSVRFVPHRGEAISVGHPLKIGIVLSGGPAPGGHNVVIGLVDFLWGRNEFSKIYGFLDGPSGIVDCKYKELTRDAIKPFRNTGGFHLIGSGRTKIETDKQFASVKATAEKLNLDGLIVVGGDDSNTNAAVLAEYFLQQGVKTRVIGVPKTIDGDLKNEYVETSFGFDTACKTYSELIANLTADAKSARKSYHFVRLMGRAASSITLECALQTHPNIVLIGEEVEKKGQTLVQLTNDISDVIVKRSEDGLNYGVVILPEGLVDFMPDVGKLLKELNDLVNVPHDQIKTKLSPESAVVFGALPEFIAQQLLLDRDPHGNVQVSKIESERLLIHSISLELARRKKAGTYKGSFGYQSHFLGYEGRCGMPSNFDANYCYTLGHVAGALIETGQTGLMSIVNNLLKPVDEWTVGGMPITHMMNMEKRSGHEKPVIRKALVDLQGTPFKVLARLRDEWKYKDSYRNPGPVQYYGYGADETTFTLQLEQSKEVHTISN